MEKYNSLFKESRIRGNDIAYDQISGGLTISLNQYDHKNKGKLVLELGHFSGSNEGITGKHVLNADAYKVIDDMNEYDTQKVLNILLPQLKKAADNYEKEIFKIIKSFK